jgi:actin-related protein 8
MGFKQLCAQQVCPGLNSDSLNFLNLWQESLAATYGAGISNACVVDIGAVKTSIACVDEGLVLPDTR